MVPGQKMRVEMLLPPRSVRAIGAGMRLLSSVDHVMKTELPLVVESLEADRAAVVCVGLFGRQIFKRDDGGQIREPRLCMRLLGIHRVSVGAERRNS